MKKLIGKDIVGRTIIVEAVDDKAVARYRRIYANLGVHLESYDRAINREAKRLLSGENRGEPEYRF